MNRKNKFVSGSHLEYPEEDGKVSVILNYFPTITALKQYSEALITSKDKFWIEMGNCLLQDSFLWHYLVCEGILPPSIILDIKKYKNWCKEQRKIRRKNE